MNFFESHLARVKQAAEETYSLAEIPKWITDHTYIKGAKYSFAGHEFQEKVVSDVSQVVNVQKCSQVGLSEVMARWMCGVCEVFPAFSVILTFPFSGDASDFVKTRMDPFIASSPRLKEATQGLISNSEMKQIHESLIYFRGTNGKTQAISTPADAIVSDEIDRSDPHILSQFESRLTHSRYKLRRNFSTPTQEGHGVSLLMETSRRFKNLCKCNHCNHWFYPDYFEHVKIPEYDDKLETITKIILPKTRYLEARVICPSCGGEPSLMPQHRSWVCENNESNFEAAGYYVSPFDAPTFITPSGLIKSSTAYARYSEFINQNLGKTATEQSESLTLHDLNECKTISDLKSSHPHAMGCDMGLLCHITIGRQTPEGQYLIVHRERVPLANFEIRVQQLAREYRVMITVCDSQPYVDLILRMQRTNKNLFGGVYITSKNMETYTVKMAEADQMKGKLPIHQAMINRDKAFDELLGIFKNREILIYVGNEMDDEIFDKHALDMKRVQVFDQQQELVYTWVKSPSAQDHYWHSSLYMLTAIRLRGAVSRNVSIARATPIMVRVKAISKDALTTKR